MKFVSAGLISLFSLALVFGASLNNAGTAPSPSRGSPSSDVADLIRSGDAHYAARADGHVLSRPQPEPIEAAIEDYRQALSKDPGNLEIYWRLIRAISFKGEYVTEQNKEKQAVFKEGIALARDAKKLMETWAAKHGAPKVQKFPLEKQAGVFKAIPGAAPYFFWTSAIWGQWALAFGKLAAAHQGAAGKIRDFATLAILTDDHYEGGGGYRVLGRLHHQSPSIPFVTGWVSRKDALANLAEAYLMAPDYKFNAVYYAEALHDYSPERHVKAIRMMEKVIMDRPSPDRIVEDLRMQAEARARLREWGGH
jgi:tetratricopeptide (TPR) repeat protein